MTLLAAGCNYHYSRGQTLEAQQRWEEAAIEYHLAYVDDPEDPDFIEALERANKVVARENFVRYKDYLAEKQFHKAYARLLDAARQDPDFQPVTAEIRKWLRVLISGQVKFAFESFQSNISLADEIRLMARINTPNPGQVIEGEIEIDHGIFFVEDLLYEPPEELLMYYTLNAIGVSLVHGRTTRKQFTNTEFVRFINFRTPVLDNIEGRIGTKFEGDLRDIVNHRPAIDDLDSKSSYWLPQVNLHYSINIRDNRLMVNSKSNRSEFTPRFLYMNRSNNRMFVDFGGYEVHQDPNTRRWGVTRIPLVEADYFLRLSQNIALRPYFFYHGEVLEYVNAESG